MQEREANTVIIRITELSVSEFNLDVSFTGVYWVDMYYGGVVYTSSEHVMYVHAYLYSVHLLIRLSRPATADADCMCIPFLLVSQFDWGMSSGPQCQWHLFRGTTGSFVVYLYCSCTRVVLWTQMVLTWLHKYGQLLLQLPSCLDCKFFHSLSITSNLWTHAWSIKCR